MCQRVAGSRTTTTKITLAGVLLLLIASTPAAAPASGDRSVAPGPRVVGTIALGRAQPIAIALYDRGNKLFVADGVSGNLLAVDPATRRVISSVRVGRDASLAVNEKAGKVYVASNGGLGKGTGTISVVSAKTGAVIKRIDPAPSGYSGKAGDFLLVNDEMRGKVYVSFFCVICASLGVIDVATDDLTPLPDKVQWQIGGGLKGVNTVTNEVFAVGRRYVDGRSSLLVIHGDTLQVESVKLPHSNEGWVDDVAVNQVNNKLYFFFSPIGAWSGLLILDRRTGKYDSIVGRNRESTQPLVFNPRTDTLFTGAGVNGTRGLIVNGATDKFTWVDFREGGMGPGAVRSSTDNAYFATVSTGMTYVLNGRTRRILKLKSGQRNSRGGFVFSSVAIDETRGLVYVVNDGQDGKITVIQDAALRPEQCVVPDVKGRLLAAATRAITKGNCRTGTIRRAYSSIVRSGRVISQKPRPGTRLAKGGKVILVVSKGKRP